MTYTAIQPKLYHKNYDYIAGEGQDLHIQIGTFNEFDQLRMVAWDRNMGSAHVIPAIQEGYIAGYVKMSIPDDTLNNDSGYYWRLEKQAEGESDKWKTVAHGRLIHSSPIYASAVLP